MVEKALYILIVDDEDKLSSSLAGFLEDEGYEVLTTDSAEKGLELVADNSFDVGIIDVRLPGMNGEDFILKARQIRQEMNFIIHTGSTEYAISEPLKNIGLSYEQVFRKPIHDATKLADCIKKLTDC